MAQRTMLVVAVAAILVGCSPGGATVNASLTEMKIAPDRSSVPSGPVTFVVKNNGTVEHELVVIKTDQTVLPNDPEEPGKVDETGSLGESGEVKPGESKTFTLTLPRGAYQLICNEPGHYAGGMHIAFTVN
jgi:uncharacterized cupredoxin-like copper-binding protein